jgi:hypothetical protein
MTPSERLKYCPERGRLLDTLNMATIDYSRQVNILSERMAVLPEAQYQQMRAGVDRARVGAENARTALLKHRIEHGC